MNRFEWTSSRARLAHSARIGVFLVGALMLGACASVQMQPTTLTPADGEPTVITVERDTEVKLDTGYTRTVRAGTRFAFVGTVPQGKVYRPIDAVLTVEGTHMHEAWVVADGEKLVGFYLPVEKSFVALSAVPTLLIKR
jgi:hypothetical protein